MRSAWDWREHGKKLKINEYGVFRGEKRIAGRTEEEVYAQVKLPDVAPELREDRGEVEAAKQNNLPRLITRDDIRGDLHCHTKASDGRSSLEEMADAAKDRGYDYLAITEHSRRLTVARGLDAKRLRHQIRQIDQLNKKLNDMRPACITSVTASVRPGAAGWSPLTLSTRETGRN